MRHALAQARYHPADRGRLPRAMIAVAKPVSISVTVPVSVGHRHRCRLQQNICIVRDRQIRHRPVYFFFSLIQEAGQRQFRLIAAD
jgi:hypothetical protein